MHRTAAIVAQGDEIVIGQTLDTNSKWIAARLLELGVVPIEHVSLPDDRAAIASAIGRLAARVDLIVCSGGLGPTSDDLTRVAVADATQDTLVLDEVAIAEIRAWFASKGRAMNVLNESQALRPSRAAMLPNAFGTAPGIHATLGACDVFCLPGPPRELMPMFDRLVVPKLRPDPERTVRVKVLHTIGLGESEIALRLRDWRDGDLMARDRMPLVGTTASNSVVSCRVRYEGPLPGPEAERLVARDVATIRSLIAEAIFGEGEETLPSVIVRMLAERRQTVTTIESCTGGLIATQLTDVAGASGVFRLGLVTYANVAKMEQAGAPPELFKDSAGSRAPGAVSAEVATAMAEGGRKRAGADFALAVTGVAGPSGGTPEKPVGTVFIALARASGITEVRKFAFTGDRAAIREWAARAALAMLYLDMVGRRAVKLLRQVELG